MRIIREEIDLKKAYAIAQKLNEVVITPKGSISPDKVYAPVKIGGEAEGFINIPPKYYSLFEEDSRRYSILTGGRSSGKSFITSVYIILRLLERDSNILYTRYTLSSMSASVIAETASRISHLGLDAYFDIGKKEITMINLGNKLYFRGIKAGSGNQTANLKSLSEISCWLCDEAEEIPDYEIFEKINLSIRTTKKNNRVIMAMNPTIKNSWQYQTFYVDRKVESGYNGTSNDCTYIHTTYLDLNPELISESFLEEAKRIQDLDFDRYSNTFLGYWTDKKTGVIFKNWQKKAFPDVKTKTVIGLDWGFRDPNAGVQICLYENSLYVREIYYQKEKTFDEIAKDLREYRNYQFICDNARPEGIKALNSKGYRATPAKKGKNSIIGGIAKLRDYKTIYVDPKSHNLIEELQNYVWNAKFSGDKPIDDYNHLIDALRYANDFMYQYRSDYAIENLREESKDIASQYVKASMRQVRDLGKYTLA